MTIQLNKDQTGLIMALAKFYAGPEQYFVLSGQAGVGKTTCMRYFAEQLKSEYPGIKICMSAPTNRACAVLKDAVNDDDLTFKTIHSILGLRMMANGEIKELKDSGEDKITDFDLIVVDEGSMVSTILLDYIKKKTALADTKIIFIGDKAQLPPVGEPFSPIWKEFKTNYELTKVERHQNSILDFVQKIRGNSNPVFESTGEQVFIDDEDSFIGQIEKYAKEGLFHTGKAKAIAWRNVTVDFLNNYIRQNNEKTKSDDKYVIGDRIVFKEPVVEGERTVAVTDEEGTVVDVSVTHHTLYPMLKAWNVKIQLDWTGKIVKTYVIHQSSEKMFQNMLDEYKNAKRWDLFWKLKEAFHNISYGYSLTSHRAQGGSYEKVFVDSGDIMLNRKATERAQCLYVACSRASKELHIFP